MGRPGGHWTGDLGLVGEEAVAAEQVRQGQNPEPGPGFPEELPTICRPRLDATAPAVGLIAVQNHLPPSHSGHSIDVDKLIQGEEHLAEVGE